jgi:glycosyltransferase involved in cell wall biosynthesis
MVRTVVLSGHDLTAWQARYVAGTAPARLPYQVDALEEVGFSLRPHGRSGGPAIAKAREVAEHRLGYPVQAALRAVPDVARADLVVALLEQEAILPSMLKGRHVAPYARTPLMVWSCWLADQISRAEPAERASLFDRFRHAELIAHLSKRETEILVDAGFAEEQLVAMTYGVSDDYYVPGPEEERDLELVAIGQDRGRDYATLFAAIEGTELTLDLVCRPDNLVGVTVPDNVRVHGLVPHEQYRSMLRRTKVMAVPTRVLAYPTGSSVALEASASGCCVVATDTPAMADYLEDGISGGLVPPGDVSGWRETLVGLRDDDVRRRALGAGARRSVETRHNATYMWHELGDVMRRRGLVRT